MARQVLAKRALLFPMGNAIHPLVARGREALARNDLRSAAAAAEERLKVHGRDVDALQIRSLVERRSGNLAAAAATLKTILGIDPRADWAYNDLTQTLFTMGRRGDAEQLVRVALRINPHNAEAHDLFGTILSELNDLSSGEWHFRRALELGGPQARCTANLALNLMQQGRTDEAERTFAAASALAPGDVRTLAHWSKLNEVRGDLGRAQELLDRAEAAGSAADVNLLRASLLARVGRHGEALAILEAAPQLNGDAHLERGRLYDRLGRYEEAWADFVAGKEKLAAEGGGLEYRADAVETFFGRLKGFFTRATLALLPRAGTRQEVPQPVFVTGFPRSGTTLVEQVLTSHSAVRAGGELAFLGEFRKLANQLFPGPEPFPENLGRTWTADNHHVATLFRDHYLARAEQAGLLAAGARFFTDKMPFNEIWLPLLRMAFPQAPIVHVVRHPLDVCVSMMSNHLTHGFNCGYRIESIVHHLAAVSDLLEHYRSEMGTGSRMGTGTGEHVLGYESFVSDQHGETLRLLAHLGLPLEPSCLSFHENRRYARTPSYAQVTEKLNDRSIGRHRHYARHLAPFTAQLGPLLARHGYRA